MMSRVYLCSLAVGLYPSTKLGYSIKYVKHFKEAKSRKLWGRLQYYTVIFLTQERVDGCYTGQIFQGV